jgi:hypothetical protein
VSLTELPPPAVALPPVPVAVPVEEGVVVAPPGAAPAGVDDEVPVVEPAVLGSVGVAVDVPFVLEDGGAVTVKGDPAGPAGLVRLVGVPGPYRVLS